MKAFDIAEADVDGNFAKHLGFQKIFREGKELLVSASFSGTLPIIIKSSKESILNRSLHESRVIGIVIDDMLVRKQILEIAKANNKIIFFDASKLCSVEKKERVANLYKMQSLMKNVLQRRCKAAVCTFAKSKEYLTSAKQLLEISRLLGAGEEHSKEMIEVLGKIL